MDVSWHPEEGIVIVGLWQGQVCRATFRMPIKDAPGMIQVLAVALGDALEVTPATRPEPSIRGLLAHSVRGLVERMRQRFEPEKAHVVYLGEYKERPNSR